jgi:hypothetical protein
MTFSQTGLKYKPKQGNNSPNRQIGKNHLKWQKLIPAFCPLQGGLRRQDILLFFQ